MTEIKNNKGTRTTQFSRQGKSEKLNAGAKVFRFYLKTFGCQMNVADSDMFAEYLQKCGCLPTENINDAEIIIINTCTVRQHAEDKAFSFIGELKKIKDGKKIVVTGCVAELYGEQLRKMFPQIDLVIGAKNIERFPELIGELVDSYSKIRPVKTGRYKNEQRVTAFVTITRGCDNFCSYCVVPYVRGQEKHRPIKEIIDEIKQLAEQGIKEVTLLGQNVNSYKCDDTDFADLLEEVHKIDGLKRIRFLTNHPKDMNDKIIDMVANLEKVCEHIHLPLQSGSDKILEMMNRKYTRKDYLNLVEKIYKKIQGIALTTDLMVGFPTETEKDFRETLNMVKEVNFDSCFCFKYSVRKKTSVSKLPDDIGLETKKERLQVLLELSKEITLANNGKLLNTIQELLIENTGDSPYNGRTRTNKKVLIEGNPVISSGQIINVKINKISSSLLNGVRS